MANFTVSPGVTTNELDQTFLSGQPLLPGAAIIGPTVKGPYETPTLVTSYSDFQTKFGDSFVSGGVDYSYLTSIAAYNYFNYGGKLLTVARVASGTFTSATSSLIPTGSSGPTTGLSPFVLETISQGIIMNNSGSEVSGSLVSGSRDNIRFEITNVNTGSGTFNVLIRQGNDTTSNKNILESFNGVNLDPNSIRYISTIIGDQKQSYNSTTNQITLTGDYSNNSNYVRVKSVNYSTPTYLNSNGTISNASYTGSLPANGSGSFGSATGTIAANVGASMYDLIGTTTQGLAGSDYDKMITLFSNKDLFQFNLLFTPGLLHSKHPTQVNQIVSNTQNRGDNLYVLDLIDYSSTVAATVTQASGINNSFAATYWPWVKILDPATGKQIWSPASTVIPGVYAFNDKIAAPWFAPAGINRGGLSTVLRAEQLLNQANKDILYSNNINPLATLPKNGVVVFGQKTLQKEASALDRVNVRRLLIELKSFVSGIANNIVFEQNTAVTRNLFLSQVTPYLENVQQKQGLYAFKVTMDESNNGPAVIDNNQLIGQIFIQPTRTAEFISLDFILLPTGAQFPN